MNVDGMIGLFPLSKINMEYTDYYMNAKGEVFSTKQFRYPRKMTGSKNGRFRSFTITRSRGVPITMNGDAVFAEVKRHADFEKETSTIVSLPTGKTPSKTGNIGIFPKRQALIVDTTSPNERHHARSAQDGVKAKGYIIGRLEGEALVFGSKPVIHTSLTSVKSEVARLAEKSPGTQIIYLKIEGSAKANSIVWE